MGRLTDGVGRQALRMASELECRGVYLGSCRIGCMLKGCLLFIDIMIADVREGRCASSSFGSVLVRFGLKRLEQRKGAWLSRALRSDGGCKKRKEEEEEEEEEK